MLEIASVFFKLGCLGFGGPVATMAMMEEETCRKRHWVTAERFAEMYAVCKLLPGPVASQMAIYLGRERSGKMGGLIAGLLFILPGFFLILLLSLYYERSQALLLGKHSASHVSIFVGFQAAALTAIAASTYQLAAPYARSLRAFWIAALTAGVVFFKPSFEPMTIFGFGLIGIASLHFTGKNTRIREGSVLLALFWLCFKSGAFVFGSGLAIVPLLEAEVVRKFHWMTHSQFMDGLAMGQMTPGPVLLSATFIGHRAAGMAGALVATIGIFLPAFVNVIFLVPSLWSRVSHRPEAKRFTEWAIPSVIGAIAGSLIRLAMMTLTSGLAWSLTLGTLLIAAVFPKWPKWGLILVSGLAGIILIRYI